MNYFKKLFKRSLSFLLAVCILCSVLPSNILATEETETVSESQAYSAEDVYPVGEITSLRDENVKHFQMSDGSVVAASYDVPIHTMEDGEWEDIDNSLSESGDELTTGNQRVKFSKKINGSKKILTIHDGNKKIEISMADAIKKTSGSIVNYDSESEENLTELQKMTKLDNISSSVIYEDILQGVDLEYIVISSTIKENIIVKEKSDTYEYEFSLKLSNLEAVLADSGDIFLMDGEDVFYTIPAPFMTDENGEISYAVSYELSGSNGDYTIRVVADASWINAENRVFPVKIDPSVYSNNYPLVTEGITSGYISSDTETFIQEGERFLTGIYNGVNHRMYWRLDTLPTLPENSIITSGSFLLSYVMLSGNTSDLKINISKVISDWDTSTLNWNTKDTYGVLEDNILDYVYPTRYSGEFVEWNILETLKGWYDGTVLNYGLCVHADETSSIGASFYSEATIAYALRPSLVIGYVSDSGIDDTRSYLEIGISETASLCVDYTSGYLKGLFSELYCEASDENIWMLDFAYNASQLSADSELENAYMGSYWRTSFDEIVILNSVHDMLYDDAGCEIYNFTDSTGAIHYMKYNSTDGLYYDTENSETVLEVGTSSFTVTYNGETYNFNSSGQLTSIVSDDNTLTVERNTTGQITQVYLNGATDKALVFTYNTDGLISMISRADADAKQSVRFTYTDSVLSGVEVMDSEGVYESVYAYQYDSNGNLTQITNLKDNTRTKYTYETSILRRILTATEEKFSGAESAVTGKYIFRYENGTTYVYEPGANGVFDNVSVSYGHVNVVNSECDDIVTAYLYDSSYRITQTYSENITGSEFYSGAVYTYDEDGKVRRITNVQDDRNINYIDTPSFTSMPTVSENDTYTYSLDSTVSKLGINSIKIMGSDTSEGEAVIKISPTSVPVGNAVFSCYVKTENVTGKVYARVSNAYNTATTGESIHLTGSTPEDVGGGWQRIFFTFEVQNKLHNVIELVMEDSSGTAYFDGFQLESNRSTPSALSRLVNGSGSYGVSTGWSKTNSGVKTYEGN